MGCGKIGVDKELLTLYKHPKLYNGSRYKFYQTNRSYGVYLDHYKGYQKEVTYKSISEPIRLNESIKDFDEYTYGSITNDGKVFYFFVDSITTDAYKQTTINFTIDWWSTNWENINCTKAHITRKSTEKPSYMYQPFTPMLPNYEELEGVGSQSACIIFTYTDSLGNDVIKYGVLSVDQIGGLENIEIGAWVKGLSDTEEQTPPPGKHKLTAQDITAIFIVPIFSIDDFINAGWNKVDGKSVIWYCSEELGSSSVPRKSISFENLLKTDEQNVYGLVDWNGNSIWQCPYGFEVSSFDMLLCLSTTHCQLRFMYDGKLGNEIVGKSFTYECRQCAIVIDQKIEYTWRDRYSEYRMRELQAIQSVWVNISDAIQGAGFGLAFGQAPGLIAAGAGGAINVLSTYMMEDVMVKEEQNTIDMKYDTMQNLISCYGDSVTPLYSLRSSRANTYYYTVNTEEELNNIISNPYLIKTLIINNYGITTFYENERFITINLGVENSTTHRYEVLRRGHYTLTDIGDFKPGNYDLICHTFKYDGEEWVEVQNSTVVKTIRLDWKGEGDYSAEYQEQIQTPPAEGNIGAFCARFHQGYMNDNYNPVTISIYHNNTWKTIGTTNAIYDDPSVESKRYIYFERVSNYYISDSEFFTWLMYLYALRMDDATKQKMNNEILANGYYCDETTLSLQSYFDENVKIQASIVTVEGTCNLQGKLDVMTRLQSGVEFI